MTGIIYIDGHDGAGKTTLAKHLVDKYGAVYLHLTYRWKKSMFTYHTAVMRYAAKMSQRRLVVIDRHWMTEDVYAHVYRGGTDIPHHGRMLDRVYLKHAAVTIICASNPDIANSRHADLSSTRVEMYTPDGKMREVAQRYCDLWDGKKIYERSTYLEFLTSHAPLHEREGCFRYSIESDGQRINDFAHKVVTKLCFLREKQYQPALDHANQNVLGYLPSARFLIVGDEANPKHPRLFWPFFEHANCSLYLARTLDRIAFREELAMYTNAVAPDRHLERLLSAKAWTRVVALGARAEKAVRSFGYNDLPIVRVSHPQHARRFNFHTDTYARELSSALTQS